MGACTDAEDAVTNIAHASSLLGDVRDVSDEEVDVWVNGPGDVRLVSFTPLTLCARTGKRLRSCSSQAAGTEAHRSLLALLWPGAWC